MEILAAIYIFLPLILSLFLLYFTIKSFRFENKKTFKLLLVIQMLLIICIFLTFFSLYYGAFACPVYGPCPPGYDCGRPPICSALLPLYIDPAVSIGIFIFGLVYYFINRSQKQ